MSVATGLGLSGCGGEPDPRPTTTPSATRTTPTPTPKPLSMAAYQALLTDSERAVRRGLDKVVAAKSLREVDAARLELADVMEAKAKVLEGVLPPERAGTLNDDATYVLRQYDALRQYDQATKHGEPNACGVRPGQAEQLAQAKSQVYWRVRGGSLEDIAAKFTKAGLSWGRQLLPPEPADPPRTPDRRARNGHVVERDGKLGPRRLRITNGTESDGVVAAVALKGDPKRPLASIYVRAGSSATLTGLSGTYSVYFKTGSDWDARRQSFTSGCTYKSFLQFFTSESDWKIDLRLSRGGNALTTDEPPF